MGPRNGKGPKERLEAVENLAGIYKVRMGDVVFMGADAELDHDVFDAVGRVVVSPFADLEKSREIARLYNRNGKVRRPADNFNQIHNAIIAP
jgi:3-deoxy-D-manno-octulosonate 8-phosphate phosphatase KdsC-like HAD superfamily phosphatase